MIFDLITLMRFTTEMPLGFKIRVVKQQRGGHNLPLLVGKGLTELPNSGWAKAHLAHLYKNEEFDRKIVAISDWTNAVIRDPKVSGRSIFDLMIYSAAPRR